MITRVSENVCVEKTKHILHSVTYKHILLTLFLLNQDNFGFDLGAVEAATRKHEAIETDIGAYGERVAAVEAVARELEAEAYHDVRRILARRDNVLRLWEYLKELLTARRERLTAHRDLQRLLQEMSHIMDWMEDMKVCKMVPPSVLHGSLIKNFNGSHARVFVCRVVCSHRTAVNTFTTWRTCSRNTHWWRQTSRRSRRGSRRCRPQQIASPLTK